MINKDVNTRTSLTLPKDLKSKLEVLAEKERRSVNNLIVNALYSYVDDNLDFEHKKKE
ncbi:MAG: ribbon-helix-helix protein, CopG family [Terrisporobacter othiniensis]|uniref:ribbon-helix-helix domain-containing protein n=1 Tax=Terrisporobacter othiniensis TaxID=1577792 RepID=UPI00291569A0|nr:ribbon-helix-helix protein, CopG family [Terrisporobacter othiniensis]MDU6985304.1 ribbon-helix-helix protein, CopG family [Terrisporobacter othiniensis]